MLPSFIMIDDFLANPEHARASALRLGYDRGLKDGNYPGVLSNQPLVIPGLEEAVGEVLGHTLKPAPGTSHNHCRITLRNEKGASGVHVDPCFYSGILYLSLAQDCRGGTDFFRHRRTGLDRVVTDQDALAAIGYTNPNQLIEEVVNHDTLKPAKWEKSFTAPMRYNRLILFSPWLFHNSGPGFGDGPENARLVHLMFFANAG